EDDGDKTPPMDNSNGKLDPGILEYVTVFSREPNKLSDGTARTNVTNATRPALTTLIRNTIGTSRADEIMARIPPGTRIRSVLQFYIMSGMTEDEFIKISPSLSMKGGDYSTGLINVNTASEAVLACVP